MEALTLTGIVTTAWTVLDSLGLNPVSLGQKEVSKQATEYVKNLLVTKPSYKNRLASVMGDLLDEYRAEYQVKSADRQFYFFQSDFLWQTALTYELFEQSAPLVPEDFPNLPHLIRPTVQELADFSVRLRAAMKADAELEKRFIEESYKAAAFHFALTGTQQLAELLARPDALSASIVHSVLDTIEREELATYKPTTAHRQLQNLEAVATRFLSADHILLARLYYLLGRTNQETAKYDQAEGYFIRAHKLQPGHLPYAEEAARAFARLDQPDQAREVLAQIQALHPLSPVAAAVQLALHPREEFDAHYAAVPAHIKQTDPFKLTAIQLLVDGTARGSALTEKVLQPDLNPYQPNARLTPENRRLQVTLAVMVVEYVVQKLPPFITLHEPPAPLDSAALRGALRVLQQYTDLLEPTEKAPFITHHYFMRGIAGWLLTGTATEYAGLHQRFAGLSAEERLRYGQQLIFTLYQAGEDEAALAALALMDTRKLPELGVLRYEVLRRLKRPRAETRAALGQYLEELGPLDDFTYVRLLIYLDHCETADEQLAFVDERLRRQQLAPGLPALLAQAHALTADPERHDESRELAQAARELLTPETPTVYRHEVATVYHRLNAFDEAGEVLEGWPGYPQALDKGAEWLRLTNQYHRGTDSAGLRDDLQAWRLRYGIHSEFCIWEIQLAELLHDWKRMLEVVEAATGHVQDASGLRWAKLLALHKLKRREKLEAELESIVHNPTGLHRRHLFNVASLAAHIGRVAWAQQLVYPLASRKEDMVARGKFFQLSLGQHGPEPAPDFTHAEVGRTVQYSVDGVAQPRLALTDEAVHGGFNTFAQELVGKEKGRKYTLPHPATGRSLTVEILEINDAYDGLFKEILEAARQKSPDLPFEPLDLEGGEDIEQLNAAFSKALGAEGAARQLRNQQLFAEYEAGQTTFSGLAVGVFHHNALEAYHVLTAQDQPDVPGFVVPPRGLFSTVVIDPDELFILDWTSLPLLYQLSKEFALTLPARLGISLHIVEYLEQKVQELQRSKPVEMTVEVIGTSVRPHFYPPEMHERHICYLQELLAWIETHCTIRIVAEKLDVLRQTKLQAGDHEVHMQYLVDTAFLAAPPAVLLVSDDTTFLQMSLRPGNVISTEVFLGAVFPTEYEATLLPKLLDLHYVGLTFNEQTLLREFKQAGGQFSGRALQSLKSLPRQLLMEPGSVQEVMNFVREVYLMATLLPEQKSRATVTVLTACLSHLALNAGLKSLLRQLLTLKFMLLQDRLAAVLADLEQAWEIRRSSSSQR